MLQTTNYFSLLSFVLVFIIGLIIGSFLSVVISRLPKGEQFIGGRSYCPHCRHYLGWHDLVPVLSFLILRGHCRYCRNKISPTYPIIELCSGIIVAVSFLFLSPFGLAYWLFWVFILELLLILALIDLRHFILPDSVMVAILVAFVCYEILGGQIAGADPVFSFGNLAGAAILFLIFFLIWSFSNGKWMGLGDIKLAGLLGLVFGFWNSVLILYLAVVMGAAAGLALILLGRGNLKTKLPFGAFICFSVIFFTLVGWSISERMGELFKH